MSRGLGWETLIQTASLLDCIIVFDPDKECFIIRTQKLYVLALLNALGEELGGVGGQCQEIKTPRQGAAHSIPAIYLPQAQITVASQSHIVLGEAQ